MHNRKIYAISVIRNEEDIIEKSLTYAKTWFDKVIVFDNGSSDRTWEIVNDISDSQIIPFQKKSVPYSDALRNEVFHAFKNELDDKDWWAIQDADEFFLTDPHQIINEYSSQYDVIASKKIDFLPSREQLEKLISANIELSLEDINTCNPWAWSEMRLFRHRKKLKWHEFKEWPDHLGRVSPPLQHIQHFPIRSISQAKAKFLEKKEANNLNNNMFKHIQDVNFWLDWIPSTNELIEGDDIYSVFSKVESRNDLSDSISKYYIKYLFQKLNITP